MQNEFIMSILTALLVMAGLLQLVFLKSQRRQNQLALIQDYRSRWFDISTYWAVVIYIGRADDEYYQVADDMLAIKLKRQVMKHSMSKPTIWALESINLVCTTLSDICIKVLQGHIDIQDVYPLFGSTLLRHSRPFRVLLDVNYTHDFYDSFQNQQHVAIRNEIQNWLIYHDGVRRRCLILLDLLWAEATRLGDLSPDDIQQAAKAKIKTGKVSRKRLITEFNKVNKGFCIIRASRLKKHLKNSEFKKSKWGVGVDKKELECRRELWIDMLLRN